MNSDSSEFTNFREISEKTHRVMHRLIKNAQSCESKALELNSSQVQVILLLRKFEILKMSDLKKHINVVKSSITNIVDVLEELNLVKRSRDKNDRRIIFVSLTQQGIDLGDSLRSSVHSSFNKLLKALDSNEKNEILSSMKILNNCIDKMENLNG